MVSNASIVFLIFVVITVSRVTLVSASQILLCKGEHRSKCVAVDPCSETCGVEHCLNLDNACLFSGRLKSGSQCALQSMIGTEGVNVQTFNLWGAWHGDPGDCPAQKRTDSIVQGAEPQELVEGAQAVNFGNTRCAVKLSLQPGFFCLPSDCPPRHFLDKTSAIGPWSCQPCTNAVCPMGEYRGHCSDSHDAQCEKCTNKPSQAIYVGTAHPFDSNNCPWECTGPFFKARVADDGKWFCKQCSTSACPTGYFRGGCVFSDATCKQCTIRPVNADFVTPGHFADDCDWKCREDYYRSGVECVLCNGTVSAECGNLKPKPEDESWGETKTLLIVTVVVLLLIAAAGLYTLQLSPSSYSLQIDCTTSSPTVDVETPSTDASASTLDVRSADQNVIINQPGTFPPYWNLSQLGHGHSSRWQIVAESEGFVTRWVQSWMKERMIPGINHGSCANAVQGMTVTRVLRVENETQWRLYEARKKAMMEELRSGGWTAPSLTCKTMPAKPFLRDVELDEKLNEFFLLHGTSEDTAQTVAQHGFDARLARMGGLYGAGIYFADNSCKACQYAKPNPQGEHVLLLCRVTMGWPHLTQAQHRGERLPPLNQATKRPHHSIFAESMVAQRGSQVHNEFVAFDAGQVYPEYIVYYTGKVAR